MKAKDLCAYIMQITQKSPKAHRYTFVTKMHNLSLEIIECIYLANETYISPQNLNVSYPKRLNLQHNAITKIKLLAYICEMAMTVGCILVKQYQHIAKLSTECQRLVGVWINSDQRRFNIIK